MHLPFEVFDLCLLTCTLAGGKVFKLSDQMFCHPGRFISAELSVWSRTEVNCSFTVWHLSLLKPAFVVYFLSRLHDTHRFQYRARKQRAAKFMRISNETKGNQQVSTGLNLTTIKMNKTTNLKWAASATVQKSKSIEREQAVASTQKIRNVKLLKKGGTN